MSRSHGYIATYVHGCRCDDCRAVETAKQRRVRAARRDPARRLSMCPYCGEWFESVGHHEIVHRTAAS